MSDTIVYLPGIAGNAGISPALQQLADDGMRVVTPDIPGFDGETGFVPPTDYLDWLAVFWDVIDATGVAADGPVNVVGASVGGMIAAELAAMRPEIVAKLALLAPFGIADADNIGFDLYAVRSPERLAHLFAKGVPDQVANRFAHKGEEEAPVAVVPRRDRRRQPDLADRRPRIEQAAAPHRLPEARAVGWPGRVAPGVARRGVGRGDGDRRCRPPHGMGHARRGRLGVAHLLRMSRRTYEALLLDIGDVITAPVWDQLDEFEQITGRTITGRGPLDPSDDPAWQRYLDGEITWVRYWEDFAAANGFDEWRDVFRELSTHLPHRFGDPAAYELMAEARRAGYKVGVLTNDGVSINGTDFFAQIPEFQALDAFVDARAGGTAKPDPEPYLRAAGDLGVEPERVVFLDDAEVCIEGAERVGMTGVLVDPVDKQPAFARTRSLLGL